MVTNVHEMVEQKNPGDKVTIRTSGSGGRNSYTFTILPDSRLELVDSTLETPKTPASRMKAMFAELKAGEGRFNEEQAFQLVAHSFFRGFLK